MSDDSSRTLEYGPYPYSPQPDAYEEWWPKEKRQEVGKEQVEREVTLAIVDDDGCVIDTIKYRPGSVRVNFPLLCRIYRDGVDITDRLEKEYNASRERKGTG